MNDSIRFDDDLSLSTTRARANERDSRPTTD